MSIYKKGWEEDPGNYRTISLTLILGTVMEQIIWSAIMQHIQDNQLITSNQLGFMKGRSCLTDLISFYDKATHLVDKGKAVDVYLNVSKAFDTISHSILLEKLASYD
ncbi:hypothetical protein DUI87_13387 [Hirundo rustica rustica]|uniref:Reverse transcriptase domain-containing protein n=1 Tax=Hirundo rustica rustica TaxID=333673 RepID=A0A3M0KAL9_HIRRU|nr:hypothetical protein DUI87_13387 [Hirundo rustica rustica]